MRQWFLGMAIGLWACAPAHGGTASAGLAVSVTVADQCLLRADSRSANCAGGSSYALGVGRERIVVPDDQLTTADKHAHTADHASYIGVARSVAGAAGQQLVLANGAVRTVAEAVVPIDAIRVTYTF